MAVTKAQVAEYSELETRAAALEREAKTYRDRQKQLEEKFEEDLKESKKPSVIRHGYTLVWVNGSATVPWAAEYLKECGVDKANALKAAAAKEATASKMKIIPPTPEAKPEE
jgi:benzoyl-CoA reductase/2-hydroxyglutaryl-CoA dehydratase subunit BcrC/BadD/HgdB